MRREQREKQNRHVEDALSRLERMVPSPPESDLRAMARTASSRSRPLPSPVRSQRWPLQPRWTGILALALVVAIGLGVGLGALIAPSGTAARGPVGLGFLPEPGWFVLQSRPLSVPAQPAVAIASNVPFHPDDDLLGLAESSALPFLTLQTLPSRGVVIAAAFSPRGENPIADPLFPRRDLPLRVRDAVATGYGRAIRDGEPLAQYRLHAAIDRHNVELFIYYGRERPTEAQLAEAQRQVSGLTVRSAPGRAVGTGGSQSAPSRVIDRTLSCAVFPQGGVEAVDVSARSGLRLYTDRSRWKYPASAGVGDFAGTFVSVSAGNPVADPEPGFPASPHRLSIVAGRTCTVAPRIPLSTAGLAGGPASQLEDRYDCLPGRRVLVRVRAVFRSATSLRLKRYRRGDVYHVANGTVAEGKVAVRSLTGRPLAYVQIFESGKARLFTARGCVED
ncbi:MAG: hypothetical protein H0U05_06810 [Actinobacteria bacterium]|nr:hypothetical protein [Actinomycetota bacterium]